MNEQYIQCFFLDGKIILDHCYLLSGHLQNRSKQSHLLTQLLGVQGVISTSINSFDPWLKHSCEMNQRFIFLNVTKKCQFPNPIFFLFQGKVQIQKKHSHLSCYPANTPYLDQIAQASSTVPAVAAIMICSWGIVKSPCKDFLNNREEV